MPRQALASAIMSKQMRIWLILGAIVVVWSAVVVLAFSYGGIKSQLIVVAVTIIGGYAGARTWREQRRFDRLGVAGFAVVHDSAVFDTDNEYRHLVQVAMNLQFEGVGVSAHEERVYRIFNLPYEERERYVPGARLPIRILPGDLSVIQIEKEPTWRSDETEYVEAHASQTPIESYA